MVRARNVDSGGICLEKIEDKMRTSCSLGRRTEKKVFCGMSTLWGQKKKRLSDAVIKEVEGDPSKEGVLGNRLVLCVM